MHRHVIIIPLIFLFIAAVMLFSYLMYKRSSTGKYNEVISSVRSHNRFVREFEAVFPSAIHSVSYFTGEYGTPTWNSKIGIGGRYLLTLQFPLSFNNDGSNLSFGEPTFYLVEVTYVKRRSDGGLDVEMDGVNTSFGSETWNILATHSGELESIGVVNEDDATPEFESAWPDI